MSRKTLRSIYFFGVAALLLALTSPASSQKMRVHFINIGQGASTLIEFPCAAMLIDTGGEKNGDFDSDDELVAYIEDFFGRRADLNKTFHSLILTHPHIDHTKGVPQVLARYRVLNAITNGTEPEHASGGPGQKALHRKIAAAEATEDPSDDIGFVAATVKTIPANTGSTNNVIDPVKCPNVDPKITVLWGSADESLGWSAKTFKNLNNHSVVVRVDFGASSMLVTGDLEEDAIPDFVAHYANSNLLDTDVYQVGHHGSANGTTDELLRAVTPKIAVISMGPPTRQATFSAWGFGHPRKTLIDLLQVHVANSRTPSTVQVATGQHKFQSQSVGRAIYGTGWDGTVILESDVNGSWEVLKPGKSATDQLDLNSATVDELAQLPAIGRVRAQAILDYRQQHGRFESVDKLTEVKGIGPATLSTIRPFLIVR